MVSRRTFIGLAGSTAAIASSGIAAPAAARAATSARTPTVEETDTSIIVDNGVVELTMEKASGRATSLVFDGMDVFGEGGRGNYDMNCTREGAALPLPPPDNGWEVRTGDDFADVVFSHSPTGGGPFWLERHHIVRDGEPGIHLANSFDHPADLHGFRCDQHRYVGYLNHEVFTHVSVDDDPIGDPWRSEAAEMPTPAELAAAPEVMDATYDLSETGSSYPRRYYTKYDWSTYLQDHRVHGLYGNGYGIWAVLADREAFCGGPVRQDLTLHQTTGRPVLLVEPQATHYGTPPVRITAGEPWQKTYGPYFVCLTRGNDPAAMRAEALRYADPDVHAEFYDRLPLLGWSPGTERSTVTGRLRVAGEGDAAGTVVVLSDDGLDFQRHALGYNSWTKTDAGGRFTLPRVRPGRYRLTAYRAGVWGEYVRDGIDIDAGTDVAVGTMTWRPRRNGRTVFQLGTPDRTSVEFANGSRFRRYGLFQRFHSDFPDGVTYVVGESTDDDWHYIQYQRVSTVGLAAATAVASAATAAPGPAHAATRTGPDVFRFDFGSETSPVAAGFTRVAHTTLYSPEIGYGLDRQVDFRDRGEPGDLQRDFTVGGEYTFIVDLADGEYDVTVISGDQIAANTTSVAVQGADPVQLTPAAGEFAEYSTRAFVESGQLTIDLSGDGRLNAVEIVAAGAALSRLSELTVEGFALNPAFSPYQPDYVVDVPYETETVTIRPVSVDAAPITVDGRPVESGQRVEVELERPHQRLEVVVDHPDAPEPAVHTVLIVREEAPWRIRFDLDEVPPDGSTVTLTVGIAAWALGEARSIPPEPSNLTIRLGEAVRVWRFQPDDARGATYRSSCAGRYYLREFTFDATDLRSGTNEIVFRINEGAPPHLGNEVAYDAIRLELTDAPTPA